MGGEVGESTPFQLWTLLADQLGISGVLRLSDA
jgi:hypothetical protein